MAGARIHLIPGEDPEEFQAFAAELAQSHRPFDVQEQFLFDQMIANGWRLRRLRKAQAQVQARAIPGIHPKVIARLQRIIAAVERSYRQAADALDRLQAGRTKESIPLFYVQ